MSFQISLWAEFAADNGGTILETATGNLQLTDFQSLLVQEVVSYMRYNIGHETIIDKGLTLLRFLLFLWWTTWPMFILV